MGDVRDVERNVRRLLFLAAAFVGLSAGCGAILGIDVDNAAVVDGGGQPEDSGGNPDGGDAGPWTRQATASSQLSGIWGSGPKSIYAVGYLGILYSAGDGTWVQQSPLGDLEAVWGVAGGTPENIYAVGGLRAPGILHSTGDRRWTAEAVVPLDGGSTFAGGLRDVWGSGASDIYAVGTDGTILHSTGTGTWTIEVSGTTAGLEGIWGSRSDDVYAVGSAGTILHKGADRIWTAQRSGSTDGVFLAIWGSGPSDVYVVGEKRSTNEALVFHSAGDGNWTRQTHPMELGQPRGVWGTGPSDIYIVGYNSTIVHGTGNGNWTLSKVGRPSSTSSHEPPLRGVWGSGPGDIYAVEFDGNILHGH